MENTDSAFTKKYMYTYLKKYIPTKYHSKLPPTLVVKGLSKKKDVQMVGPHLVLGPLGRGRGDVLHPSMSSLSLCIVLRYGFDV